MGAHIRTQGDKHASSSALHGHDAVLRADGSRLDTTYIHVFTLIRKGEHGHKLACTNVSLNVTLTVRVIEAEIMYIALI